MAKAKWTDRLAAVLDATIDRSIADDSVSMLTALAALEAGHKLMHAEKIEDACKFLTLATSYFLSEMSEEDEEDQFMNLIDRLADSMLDPKSAEGTSVKALVRQVQENLSEMSKVDDDINTHH